MCLHFLLLSRNEADISRKRALPSYTEKHLFNLYFDFLFWSHLPMWRRWGYWSILKPATRGRWSWFAFNFGCCHVVHVYLQYVVKQDESVKVSYSNCDSCRFTGSLWHHHDVTVTSLTMMLFYSTYKYCTFTSLHLSDRWLFTFRSIKLNIINQWQTWICW